ncbi:MAG: ABC transporter permease subunit [Planctomycetaceae bacterium]|jgi:ABC-type transport system involved in multi-copper enzyme maturation permease subunit|nr:ABC transporter permease subunit [Planctomycetaceae bacterium]MBT6153074.1 ABC transporter permease subunit [Planctomycetaceae bacterium]MBT6487939.1 ABC transporter permease subunit [Planctomycetaceae bacterium]MBT6498024.1 ABC transporter permease subunit [Planctomycetaceae bacterium]
MSLLSLPANTLLAAAGDAAPSSLQWNMTTLVVVLALAALFAVLYTTRAGIIARATTKEAIRQPVFILMLVVALVILVINTFLPFFTLGDDVKMLKDCGLATILICSLLIAVWTASTSIADEIEGKTAMTLLSKPINRRQFIVGKYLGIVNAVMALLVPLSICLLALIYFKVGYDAKESSKVDPLHAERMIVVMQTVPGLLLILLEVAVLSAVSVAISTRLPMIVNLVTCFSIFVIGHLTPVLVQSDVFAGKLEFVQFMALAIATVLPALELFNISAAVATDSVVPPVYLGTAAIYCAAYSTAAILLAFILFEDRDLA